MRSQAGPVETGRVEAGDPGFVNNIPDPRLAGDELPSVKSLLAWFLPQREHGRILRFVDPASQLHFHG